MPNSSLGKIQAPALADVLAHMQARRQIAKIQFKAGRELQSYYERARIGGAMRISFVAPFAGPTAVAFRQIEKAEALLGDNGTKLMRDVLCLGYTIKQCCVERLWLCAGLPSPDWRDPRLEEQAAFWGYRFKSDLNTVAEAFEPSTPKKQRPIDNERQRQYRPQRSPAKQIEQPQSLFVPIRKIKYR